MCAVRSLLLAAALLPFGAQAEVTFARVDASALLSNAPTGTEAKDTRYAYGLGPLAVTGDARLPASPVSVQSGGVARSDFGSTGVSLSSAVLTDDAGSTSGYARSYFFDTLTFDAPGLTGLSGQVTLAYRMGGTFRAEAGPGSAAGASVSLSARFGNAAGGAWGQLSNDGGTEFRSDLMANDGNPSFIMLTADIVWGEAYDTTFESFTGTWAASSGGGRAFAAVDGTTGLWGGIASATQGGTVVTGFTVSSFSGTDYSRAFPVAAPVPDAPQAALMLAGLAVVAGWTRRRARRE